MKSPGTSITIQRITFCILLCSMLTCLGQAPPPNDNFADRIILSGSQFSFTGTLAGSTFEHDPTEIFPNIQGWGFSGPRGTVWWEWTAADTTTVILQILNPSQRTERNDAVGVFNLVNIYTGSMVGGTVIDTRFPYTFFSFPAQAGTNYFIQLAGTDGARFGFRLTATNLPYIIEQPQSQTVSTNDSFLLTVLATGLKPFTYQWQLNGANIPGETAPMLAIDHVTTNQTGVYRVIITNAAGITISAPANIVVTTRDNAASLLPVVPPAPDQFAFALFGEVGRRYRVESSSDLLSWNPELSFPSVFMNNLVFPLRSTVLNRSGADSFGMPRTGLQRFYHVAPFHAVNEVCNNNIKQLRFAQLLYGYDHVYGAEIFYVVTLGGALRSYFKNSQLPLCPSNGLYFVSTILINPSCTFEPHVFEER